jgi:phage terminase large subunit-like protein
MSAACDRFYGQVVNKTLSHDADARLAQHLANAIVKETPQGALITKDRRGSKRKIDLAIAAVLAMEGTRLEPEEVTPYFAVF